MSSKGSVSTIFKVVFEHTGAVVVRFTEVVVAFVVVVVAVVVVDFVVVFDTVVVVGFVVVEI